ncbi:MAG: DEAD/DEAH box helicase [Candidatus Zhuqueibacterota bacterium]
MAIDEKINPLDSFHPAIQQWFKSEFEQPTPPQVNGWPAIAQGENTLILAPTGSGKTLAAFLVCMDDILKQLAENPQALDAGVHTLYISPLKALNYDIERNLRQPLAGIWQKLTELEMTIPRIEVAVRTGDTPQKERQRMLRRPPHILITTPESLHLLLTSQRAREILRTVKFVIVDEIHALSDNKRGTFLSILLERLQQIAAQRLVRIGLSATQKPLEEIAKFLAGCDRIETDGETQFKARPVTIVDAGIRKELDLRIVSPVDDFRDLPEDTVWPDIYQKLLELIQQHRSTLIFTNSRAAAERITAEINERAGYELAKAHHGSVSKEARRDIEAQLKRGELTALVATATLELGIDMGAIDLVCQVESPKDIARGLQRVGRAGHLYKTASKGRLLPKMRSDLLEMAVVTRAMRRGDVSPIKIPRNCLDILAQQIIAMVALQPWSVDALYHLVRQAYPFQNLPRAHFYGVVEMISGRYPAETFRELRPRISWDRVNQVMHALPGSQRLALMSAGAIPDTGQYGCYLEDNATKIGELEEEFIFERRLGEVIILGTNNWRIKEITHDRVIVTPAPGEPARMPFWKGEMLGRSYHLGQLHGEFCRVVADKMEQPGFLAWLQNEFSLDETAARNLSQFLNDQKREAGVIPDDRTVLIEGFTDEMGDLRVTLLTPFGGRLHLPWKLAILAQFRRQLGIEPESLHSDAGLVFRYPVEKFETIVRVIRSVTSENVEALAIEELANSAFFGLRFRQNANRAMLLPRPQPGKRAPLWLQRIRSRDLLEVARKYPSFPIVMETYRESLQDFLALDELKQFLGRLERGDVSLVIRRSSSPSPFAASMMFEFMTGYMYEYDAPKAEDRSPDSLDKDSLAELLHPDNVQHLLDETAIEELEARLQHRLAGYQARTPSELAELLLRMGDLTPAEISQCISSDGEAMLRELTGQQRVVQFQIPNATDPERWIAADLLPEFRAAFEGIDWSEPGPTDVTPEEARWKIMLRFVRHQALVTVAHLQQRYGFEETAVLEFLNRAQGEENLVRVPSQTPDRPEHWAFRETLERIRRITIRQQRNEIQTCDTAQFVEFLLKWQHRSRASRLAGADGLIAILEQFQGISLPAYLWESEIFGRRVEDYRPEWIDDLCRRGEVVWQGTASATGDFGNLSFLFREDFPIFQFNPETTEDAPIHAKIKTAMRKLGACFVSDIASETGLPPSLVSSSLWELIWRGEVNNDTLAAVRAGKPAQPAERADDPARDQASRKRYGRTHRYRPVAGSGRWALLPGRDAAAIGSSAMLEALARQILLRYGMVSREIFQLENWPVPWRSLYEKLVQLEWRGEIRRGYFVRGFSGMQFALPEAADLLRSDGRRESNGHMALINTCDPANLYGAASPLPVLHPFFPDWRLLRHPNNFLVLQNGVPILAIEARGERLTPLRDLSHEEKQSAISLLPDILFDPGNWRRIRGIRVEEWNGAPVRKSEIAGYLKQAGFRDEFKMMILERPI